MNFMPFFLPTFSFKKSSSAKERERRGVDEARVGQEMNAQLGGIEEAGIVGEMGLQRADNALVTEATAQEAVEQSGGDQRDRPILQACSA